MALSRFSCVLTALLLSLSLYAQSAIVGYWRFEEGPADTAPSAEGALLDSTGNGLLGDARMNTGGLDSAWYRTDVPVAIVPATGASNALSFDFLGNAEPAPRDHVRVATFRNPTLLTPRDAITLECYAKFDKLPGASEGNEFQLVNKWGGVGSKQWVLKLRSDGKLMWSVSTNGSSGAGNAVDALGTSTLTSSQWYHIAATYDGQTARLYLDGVQDGTASFAAPQQIHNSGPNMLFGTNQGASPGALDGHLDEMRMSNTALEPHEFLNVSPAATTVRNPGAEQGTGDGATSRVDEWVTLPGHAPLRRSSGIVSLTPHSGSYFFYGGPAPLTGGYQELLLPVPGFDLLAANGLASGYVSGWFSSDATWGGSPDAAKLEMQLLDAGGNVLDTISTGLQSLANWNLVEADGPVPAGTAKARVQLIMQRSHGTNNDGYVDDVDAGFALPTSTANLLVNGDAEAGDITGWTLVAPGVNRDFSAATQVGAPPSNLIGPHDGDFFFEAGQSDTSQVYQDLDVSQYAPTIDADLAFGVLDLWMSNNGSSAGADIPNALLYYFDAVGSQIGDPVSTTFVPAAENIGSSVFGVWEEYTIGGYLPAGTRSVRVFLDGHYNGGTQVDAFFDDVDYRLYLVPEPTSALLLGLGLAAIARRRRRKR